MNTGEGYRERIQFLSRVIDWPHLDWTKVPDAGALEPPFGRICGVRSDNRGKVSKVYFLTQRGWTKTPDGFIALVVEQGHRHIAGVLLERKVEGEYTMQFLRNDPIPETSIEFLSIGAWRDLFEEFFTFDRFALFVAQYRACGGATASLTQFRAVCRQSLSTDASI